VVGGRSERSPDAVDEPAWWDTDHGRLDVVFRPTGTTGFGDLARDALYLEILGARVNVASLADVV
jgi:hypothetical protein